MSDWDTFVIGCVTLSVVGWIVTVTVWLDPTTATRLGLAAALTSQLWALAGLLHARHHPTWRTP